MFKKTKSLKITVEQFNTFCDLLNVSGEELKDFIVYNEEKWKERNAIFYPASAPSWAIWIEDIKRCLTVRKI